MNRRTSRKSSSLDIASHSLLRRTSVRSAIEHLERLLRKVRALASICSSGQHRALRRAPAGVADPRRVVADDQDDQVARVLEGAKLVEHHARARGGCRGRSDRSPA